MKHDSENQTSGDTSSPVRISGVLVTFNAESRLEECLRSMWPACAEIIVVDIGSSDASVAIARAAGARVVFHPWVPVVEQVRAFAVAQANHEWILFLDPDLVVPSALVLAMHGAVNQRPALAGFLLPCRNHFLNRQVRHTRWGGRKVHMGLFHRDRMRLTSRIHEGISAVEGGEVKLLDVPANVYLHHHWVDSMDQMLEKHRRYYLQEGVKRRGDGKSDSLLVACLGFIGGFVQSYILRSGWLDGRQGLFLSIFWGIYRYNGVAAQRALGRTSASDVDGAAMPTFGVSDEWIRKLSRRLLGDRAAAGPKAKA